MVSDVTRYIELPTERELWARAAGRCEFNGCNTLLYKSAVTQETVNLAQKAHIYSFSEKGPRGWGPIRFMLTRLNDISNLMLMCHGCHQKIDQDKSGIRYSAELLIGWKNEHEQRIEIVTGIQSDKRSHIIIYGANIGAEKSPIIYHNCVEAMFPNSYPASERPNTLSMNSNLKDSSAEYWQAESSNLFSLYERKISPLIEQDSCKSFSLFALAPQPLLIQLGALFTDKTDVETYQLHREPKGWQWNDCPENFDFILRNPNEIKALPVLLISLSDHVTRERITNVLGQDVSIWEITLETPHNDFMKSKEQLSLLRKYMRQLMVDIKQKHGNETPLHIFPVMPVSCAIELGRIRMPKAEMPWIIYDQDFGTNTFVKSLELRGDLHALKQ
jgi:SMODS-associated and fused to various effectors sensor domain